SEQVRSDECVLEKWMFRIAKILGSAIWFGCAGFLIGWVLSCFPALYLADFRLMGAAGEKVNLIHYIQYSGMILGTLAGAGFGIVRAHRQTRLGPDGQP